jgi:hypothetical protein
MEKREIWSARVQQWRASGVSMNEFSRGKEYTASNLSYWARQLASESSPPPKSVRLARVVRSPRDASAAPKAEITRHAAEPRSLVIECGLLRVHVPDAADGVRLETILVAVARAAKAGSP